MGVAVGSVLFLRWLNYHRLDRRGGSAVHGVGQEPEIFIRAFQSSWLVMAGLTSVAILTSAMRGADARRKEEKLE